MTEQVVPIINVSRFVAAFLFLTSSTFTLAQGGPIALTNANLFNGTEDEITEDVTVFVRDGLIERIATGDVDISGDYEVIDTEGNYLIPGLFDVHTHIDSVDRAKQSEETR